jgi:hypothetical protein
MKVILFIKNNILIQFTHKDILGPNNYLIISGKYLTYHFLFTRG